MEKKKEEQASMRDIRSRKREKERDVSCTPGNAAAWHLLQAAWHLEVKDRPSHSRCFDRSLALSLFLSYIAAQQA
jgi:hypothetical protein